MNNNLLSVVHSCHKILIDRDLIGGTDAMHDIIRLIFIKLYKPDLLNNVITWNMLSHECNKIIFNSDDDWRCCADSLDVMRLKILNYINSTIVNHDVIGYIYEDFINKYSSSAKLFGQFFTTRNYIKIIFDQIPSRMATKSPTMFDPCMGTGGFIMEAYKYFNMSAFNLSGCELEPETYKYALMNIITTTGDSIIKYNTSNFINGNALILSDPRIKYDIIPTNPPYGTKMNYKNLESLYNINWATELKDITFPKWSDIFPIKTNNGVALFLQFIVYKLKPNGIALPIIPTGEIIYGRNFGKLRKYLGEYTSINKIMNVDAGIFKHADIRTSVIWMHKHGSDYLQDNTQKNISILQADKTFIKSELIGDICPNTDKNWSWDINDYKINNEPEWMGCKWMTLGELCTSNSIKGRPATYGKSVGLFPYFTSSSIVKSYVDETDYNTESIIIGTGGKPNINYSFKFSAADHCRVYQIRPNIPNINLKYVYYYISNNMHVLSNIFKGTALRHATINNISTIRIPVPAIDIQNKIIIDIDALEIEKKEYVISHRIKLTEFDTRARMVWQ